MSNGKKITLEEKIAEIEARRKQSSEYADFHYYNPLSPHYRNNERYTWAINVINAKAAEDIEKAMGNE